jgi:hypothetical protein
MENLETPSRGTVHGLSEQQAPFSSAMQAALDRFQNEQKTAL